MMMQKDKKILKGLSHTDYEHPFDKKALNTLEKTPGLSTLGKFISKHMVERLYTVENTGNALKVTNSNYPKIYEYLEYASQILDLGFIPDLYIQWGYNINACTVGAEYPIIVLNSGLIDLCDDDEILFVVGHECGHIKSNHMLYHMMASVINYVINVIPGGNLVAAPVQYALYYWDRMSEFTADRAGFLTCQNKDAVVKAFMKMSGLPIKEYNNMNYQTFIQQAESFQSLDYDTINKIAKFISISNATHPFSVMRASELLKWINSEDYLNVFDSMGFRNFKLKNSNKYV